MFSKPSLENFISKDANLILFISLSNGIVVNLVLMTLLLILSLRPFQKCHIDLIKITVTVVR